MQRNGEARGRRSLSLLRRRSVVSELWRPPEHTHLAPGKVRSLSFRVFFLRGFSFCGDPDSLQAKRIRIRGCSVTCGWRIGLASSTVRLGEAKAPTVGRVLTPPKNRGSEGVNSWLQGKALKFSLTVGQNDGFREDNGSHSKKKT